MRFEFACILTVGSGVCRDTDISEYFQIVEKCSNFRLSNYRTLWIFNQPKKARVTNECQIHLLFRASEIYFSIQNNTSPSKCEYEFTAINLL